MQKNTSKLSRVNTENRNSTALINSLITIPCYLFVRFGGIPDAN